MMQELQLYARDPINGRSYIASTPNDEIYSVIGIAKFDNRHVASADLIVEWQNDTIIIHHDTFSIPFHDSLVDLGIPRERIILAYAGETMPDSKPTSEA